MPNSIGIKVVYSTHNVCYICHTLISIIPRVILEHLVIQIPVVVVSFGASIKYLSPDSPGY